MAQIQDKSRKTAHHDPGQQQHRQIGQQNTAVKQEHSGDHLADMMPRCRQHGYTDKAEKPTAKQIAEQGQQVSEHPSQQGEEKGSRIARIIEELHGEKIDIVRYDKDPAVFIENALSPAKNLTVAITDPKKQEAMVIADKDNFSLAIGKKGQNARLASRLTHYKIDIKTTEQAREAGINFR